MQFVVMTRRKMEEFPAEMWTADAIAAESARVREMYAAGAVRSIWRRKDMPGSLILMEAANEEEVRTLIGSLPLAQRGMLEFVLVTELEPYPGFGPR